MFNGKLGIPELILLAVIALLFFGPSKLGDLGKGLGEAINNFKGAMSLIAEKGKGGILPLNAGTKKEMLSKHPALKSPIQSR